MKLKNMILSTGIAAGILAIATTAYANAGGGGTQSLAVSGLLADKGQINIDTDTSAAGYEIQANFENIDAAIKSNASEIDSIEDHLTFNNQTAGVTSVPFRVGVTDDGKYGYILPDGEGGADTVHPFSSGNGYPYLYTYYGGFGGSGDPYTRTVTLTCPIPDVDVLGASIKFLGSGANSFIYFTYQLNDSNELVVDYKAYNSASWGALITWIVGDFEVYTKDFSISVSGSGDPYVNTQNIDMNWEGYKLIDFGNQVQGSGSINYISPSMDWTNNILTVTTRMYDSKPCSETITGFYIKE